MQFYHFGTVWKVKQYNWIWLKCIKLLENETFLQWNFLEQYGKWNNFSKKNIQPRTLTNDIMLNEVFVTKWLLKTLFFRSFYLYSGEDEKAREKYFNNFQFSLVAKCEWRDVSEFHLQNFSISPHSCYDGILHWVKTIFVIKSFTF